MKPTPTKRIKKVKACKCKVCGHSENFHMPAHPPHADLIVCEKDGCHMWDMCSGDEKLRFKLTGLHKELPKVTKAKKTIK